MAPVSVWKKNWVVHSQHAGRAGKVLDYLGCAFRIAIANSRIESIADGMVRFHYRDNRSQQLRRVTLTGVEFLGRFLQHVLPRGVMEVRHYGILSPSWKARLQRARQLLPSKPTAAARPRIHNPKQRERNLQTALHRRPVPVASPELWSSLAVLKGAARRDR